MNRNRPAFSLAPALVLVCALTACEVIEQAGSDIADGRKLTAEQLAAQRAAQRGEVLKVDRPYYGSAVNVERGSQQGKPLPKALEGARGISIKLTGQSDISTIASAITQVSDIPVSVRTRYILPDGDVVEVPIGSRMPVDFEGPLSRLLDQIGSRMDVAWTHEDGGITIDRMVTRDYRVPLPTSSTKFTSELGGATGTDDSNTSIGVETNQESDPWSDLTDRLTAITPTPAQLTVLRSSGRVSVFGPPSVQKKVISVLEDIEIIYGQRVGLEVGVYFLNANEAEDFGLKTAGYRIGGSIARGSSKIIAIGTGLDAGLRYNDARGTVDLQALAQDAAVVDFRLASTIAQSGQVAPIAITRHQTYIKSSKTTSEGSSTIPGTTVTSTEIEPGEVVYGLSIHAIPRIIDDDRIQLVLTVLQSDLVGGVIKQLGSGVNTIGAPELDQRAIQNQSILSPGETLVLSGYEQNLSSTSRSGVGLLKAIGLGGKVSAQTRKVRMVVLVRPTLIPQGRGRS